MHPEEQALLAAIVADPDDDTPRLAYADWLDEHDRPERAELIRVQIGMARTKGEADPRRRDWNARQRHLLHQHSRKWRKELPRVPTATWGPFERGFVESVHLNPFSFRPDAVGKLSHLFGHVPLRVLRFHVGFCYPNSPEGYAGLLAWPGLERFAELHFFGAYRWYSGLGDPRPAFFSPLWNHHWGARPLLVGFGDHEFDDAMIRELAERPGDHPIPVLDFGPSPGVTPGLRVRLRERYGDRVRFG